MSEGLLRKEVPTGCLLVQANHTQTHLLQTKQGAAGRPNTIVTFYCIVLILLTCCQHAYTFVRALTQAMRRVADHKCCTAEVDSAHIEHCSLCINILRVFVLGQAKQFGCSSRVDWSVRRRPLSR